MSSSAIETGNICLWAPGFVGWRKTRWLQRFTEAPGRLVNGIGIVTSSTRRIERLWRRADWSSAVSMPTASLSKLWNFLETNIHGFSPASFTPNSNRNRSSRILCSRRLCTPRFKIDCKPRRRSRNIRNRNRTASSGWRRSATTSETCVMWLKRSHS